MKAIVLYYGGRLSAFVEKRSRLGSGFKDHNCPAFVNGEYGCKLIMRTDLIPNVEFLELVGYHREV